VLKRTLPARRESLHGHWSSALAPAMTIDSGDTVSFECLDAMWCDGRPDRPWPWKRFEPRDELLDRGHALTGPVFVRGARPGTTLEISIDRIVPDAWGWTLAWLDPTRARALGLTGHDDYMQTWDIDPANLLATDATGRRLKLRPFMGVMGVAPPAPGVHATTPPRIWGGNLDCKELVAGTKLYLPVGVDGALFSTGDGHAAQGDGEVSGFAVECPMTSVDLTFRVLDRPLKAPRARTSDAWITFGLGDTLDAASTMALNHMLDLIEEQFAVPRAEALALASIAADLRVTQVVNQTQGVHMILRDEAFR
jgi:acetamidase/formamidase